MPRVYSRGSEPIPGFRLVELLGKGGFGEVWKATAPGGTEVALKIISLETKQGFKEFRAICMIKGVHHAHLVPIVAFWLKDRDDHLFMEGLDDSANWKGKGGELIIEMGLGDKNLLDRLRECEEEGLTGIPPDELLDYMEDAAKAIDFLNKPIHNLGGDPAAIQHCDIKPQNLMLVGGSVQVCDFGLARILGDARVTASAMTIPYTPPELFSVSQPSATSDQYSLAITYIELRTGRLPFDTGAQAHMIYAHLQGKLNLTRLLPAEAEVIRRATATDPAARYPTTVEMVRALRKAYEGESVPASFSSSPINLLELAPDTELVPGYVLVRRIGKGGYGEVWEAVAPGGKRVALKIVGNLTDLAGKQEFKALELIKGVEHNHLLELHAYWLLDEQGRVIPDRVRNQPNAPVGKVLVVASKLASKNLAQRLQECRQEGLAGIPVPELLAYMRQAADAIDYLNAPHHPLDNRLVSIQHRDIKPENILIAANTVKVGDFGLAKVVEGTDAEIHRNSEGLTLGYAAPEIFHNRVTLWSDQYSLAITYYRLRTGNFPFPPAASILAQIERRPDFSALPQEEAAVLARATAVVPEERFPTCLAFVEALERACLAAPNSKELKLGTVPPPAEVPPSGPAAKPATGRARPVPLPASPPSGSVPDLQPTSVGPAVVPEEQDEVAILHGETLQPSSYQDSVTPRPLAEDFPPIAPTMPKPMPAAEFAPVLPSKPKPEPKSETPAAALPKQWAVPSPKPQPSPAWKTASRPDTRPEVKQRPPRPPFRIPKKWVVAGLLVLMTAGMAAGATIWVRNVRDSFIERVRSRIEQGQYEQAAEELEKVGPLEWFFRDGCREEVRTAWLLRLEEIASTDVTGDQTLKEADGFLTRFAGDEHAEEIRQEARAKVRAQALARLKQIAAADAAGDRTLAESRIFLQRFPEDPDGKGIYQDVLVKVTSRDLVTLIAAGDYPKARQRLEAAGIENSETIKELRGKIDTAWIDSAKLKAEKHLARKEFQAALDALNGLPEDLQKNPALTDLRRSARQGIDQVENRKFIAAVEKLIEQKEYAKAASEWMNRGKALSREDRDDLRKRIADSWREDLRHLAKERKPETEAGCKTFLSYFPNDPEVKQFILDVQGPAPEAIVKSIQDRERSLDEDGPVDQARDFFTSALADPEVQRSPELQMRCHLALARILARSRFPRWSEVKKELDQAGTSATVENYRRAFAVLEEAAKPFPKANAADQLVLLDKLTLLKPPVPLGKWERQRVDAVGKKLVEDLRGAVEKSLEGRPFEPELNDSLKVANKITQYEANPAVERLKVLIDALLRYREKKLTLAASKIVEVDPAVWKTGERRKSWAVEILQEAAQSLWNKNPQRLDLGQQDARQAFDWLSKAIELGPSPPDPEMLSRLVLAAWYRQPTLPNVQALELAASARPLIRDNKQLNPKEVYEVLWIHAHTQADSPAGREAALTSYADLLDWVKENEIKVEAKDHYQRVIEPALEIGKQLNPAGALRAKLAKCYAARGRLLADNYYADLPVSDRNRVAFDSYDEAIRLDDTQASYYVGRANARIRLGGFPLTTIKDDAELARKRDDQLPVVFTLLGYVQVQESRREVQNDKRLKKLEQALQNYEEAFRLCQQKKQSQELAVLLLNRSQVYLELANFTPDSSKVEEYLTRALTDAEDAVDRRDRLPYPEWAWEAQGNALEDLADFAGQSSKWKKAVDAFAKATEKRKEEARNWTNLGRCQYKWVKRGGQNPAYLDSAIESLKKALAARPNPVEKAKAASWLALACLYAHKAEADQYFRLAAEAPSPPSREWDLESLQWAGQILEEVKKDYFPNRAGFDLEACERLVAAARERIGRVNDPAFKDEVRRLEIRAAYVLGELYEHYEKPKEAIKAYKTQLSPNGGTETSDYVPLMTRRVYLLLDNLSLDNLNQLALADYAERAVQLARQPAVDKATRARALGAAALALRLAVLQLQSADDQRRYMNKSRDYFREAIKEGGTACADQMWIWQWSLGKLLEALALDRQLDPTTQANYRKEAKQNYEDALKSPWTPPKEKKEIREKLDKLGGY